MTGSLDKPQIVIHSSKGLNYTSYDVKWIPRSAKFVSIGQAPRGVGILQVYSLENGQMNLKAETEKPNAFKCGTFAASNAPLLATGDFGGRLSVWDLETFKPTFSTMAHESLVNCVDGAGGSGSPCGPPELATASRDGSVKVWDVRQPQSPVAIMASESTNAIDCWTCAFGNSYNDVERCLVAGYENGDVKVFDLKMNKVLWETNVSNGVCCVEFDRKDIKMNKLIVSGLESMVHVFDMRTYNAKSGYTGLSTKQGDAGTTVWTVRHLPQNRDVFMTSGGSGSLSLFKYKYPSSRVAKDKENVDVGVVGSLEPIQTNHVAEQPIGSLDWCPEKLGLFCCAAYDQTLRVGLVTRLNQY